LKKLFRHCYPCFH